MLGREQWHGQHSTEAAYSIDYMIGEEEYLHKGIDTILVKALFKKLFEETSAGQIIVQPNRDNIASCQTLLAAGYSYNQKNELYEIRREDEVCR